MGSRGDLHTHSTFSDGVLTPKELIELAYRRGVRVLALTDHDTTDGLPQAFDAVNHHSDLTLIPGIEMSTELKTMGPRSSVVKRAGSWLRKASSTG